MSAEQNAPVKSVDRPLLRELEGAKFQVEALFQLIEDHIYAVRNDADHGDVEHIAFEVGLNELIKSTQRRLNGAVQGLFNASRQLPEQSPVASN